MAFPERSEKIPGSENFFSGKIVTLNWLHGWSQVIRSFGECVIYATYISRSPEKCQFEKPPKKSQIFFEKSTYLGLNLPADSIGARILNF